MANAAKFVDDDRTMSGRQFVSNLFLHSSIVSSSETVTVFSVGLEDYVVLT